MAARPENKEGEVEAGSWDFSGHAKCSTRFDSVYTSARRCRQTTRVPEEQLYILHISQKYIYCARQTPQSASLRRCHLHPAREMLSSYSKF